MKHLTHSFQKALILSLLSLFLLPAGAQPRSQRFFRYEDEGETLLYGTLDSIYIYNRYPTAAEMRRGQRKIEKFTRTRWNVHKVYPYAVKIEEILQEVEGHLAGIPDARLRKQYLQEREKQLFGEYEDDLRAMTRSQGRILVKLVHRQTGQSGFELIRQSKSGAAAVFWQSVSTLFGINLRSEWDSDEEENQMIDVIVRELEDGGYNIVYKQYNFRL